jgi:predicted DNA-binding antitoxin AbrB/MazE fold protein
MSQYVDAIYEDGVLKPAEALGLAEHEAVKVRVERLHSAAQKLSGLEDLIDWEALAWARDLVGERPEAISLEAMQRTWSGIEGSMTEAVLEARRERWEE